MLIGICRQAATDVMGRGYRHVGDPKAHRQIAIMTLYTATRLNSTKPCVVSPLIDSGAIQIADNMTLVQDESISTRLRKLSKKELQRRDVFGRTILHLVCIVGRFDLLRQLLENPNLNIFVVDYESGWTGLHCSIFYGKLSCARLLLDHKYELIKIKDRSGLTAMDLYYSKYSYQNLKIFPTSIGKDDTNYIQRFENVGDIKIDNDDVIWWDREQRGGSDVYTFGSNVNNQLGTGDSTDKMKAPYKVDIKNFRLDDPTLGIADRLARPRLRTIVLSKNHSVILTNEHQNNIMIAGSSLKGRLGSSSKVHNFKFNTIKFFEDDHIVDVAVCDDHTLALNSSGEVYSWGLNNFYQLGYNTEKIQGKSDSYSIEPKRVLHVLKKFKVKGISCSKTHSVAFAGDSLISWGLNTGQMGFSSTGEQVKSGKYKGIVQIPRDFKFPYEVKQVIATDEYTIVLLQNNDCHILGNGKDIKYQLPVYRTLNDDFEHFKPSVFSKRKKIIKLASKDCSNIGILYNDGSVLGFGIDKAVRTYNLKYSPVWTPRNSHLKCIDVDMGQDGSIIICTKSGCVFKRIFKDTKRNEFKFTKIEKLSNIVKVSCDSLFSSFGFIRDGVDQLPLQLEKDTIYQDIAYLSPLTPAIPSKKKQELVNNNESNLYTVDFLHRPDLATDDEFDIFQSSDYINDNGESEDIRDPLIKSYRERWTKPQKVKSTALSVSSDEFLELVQSDDLKYRLNIENYTSGKGYDLRFNINDCSIGVHSSFLFSVKKFQQIKSDDLTIGDMSFGKITRDGTIKVRNVVTNSLLIILHFLYTGVILKPWANFSKTDTPELFQRVKLECSVLIDHLKISNGMEAFHGNSKSQIPDFKNFENDLTILLDNDEELSCCSLILKSRSAYFETLLSDRWGHDNLQVMEFRHVNKIVFQAALDYIYGKELLTLWDHHTEIKSIPEFINLQFDLIELSDELLLFGLKDFAQLMIKDFISQDNCLIVLHHAEELNCQKLIGQCLWFIYNNIHPLLTDISYSELLSHQMIVRTDKYCRWLNRVNKFSIHETKTTWLDGDSDELVRKFLNDDREFNDIFLESDDFVPVFDLKHETPSSLRRQKAEPVSRSPPPMAAHSVPVQRKTSDSSFNSERKKSVTIDSSSAVDNTEEEFQPVINSRRRRSSANKRRASSHNDIPPIFSVKSKQATVVTPTKSIPIPVRPISMTPRNGSMSSLGGTPSSLDKSYWPTINGKENLQSSSSSSSVPKASKIVPPKEPLGITYSNLVPSKSLESLGTSSKSAWKSTPNVKLSQKERKRLQKQPEVSNEEKKESNGSDSPWKIPASSSIKPLSIDEAQHEALLVKEGLISQGKYRDYQLNPQAVTVTKSFFEIQQEQEFAAWWEEESRKVQSQVNSWNSFSSSKPQKLTTKSKSKNTAGKEKAEVNPKSKSRTKKVQPDPLKTKK